MKLGKSALEVPNIAIGCMRSGNLEVEKLAELISFCVKSGYNFFDHADIYGGGNCETNFGKAFKMTGLKRENVIIQSKCGIVPTKMYDFSKEHILKSVDGILERLDMEYAKQDILVDQLQLSITESNMIASGLEVNMNTPASFDHDRSVLDYCRIHDITVQAWSPFQFGYFEGCFIDHEKYPKLNETLDVLAKQYGTSKNGIATAWILRHPAHIQMVTGSSNLKHLQEIFDGDKICLSRQDWYKLYLDAGHILP